MPSPGKPLKKLRPPPVEVNHEKLVCLTAVRTAFLLSVHRQTQKLYTYKLARTDKLKTNTVYVNIIHTEQLLR